MYSVDAEEDVTFGWAQEGPEPTLADYERNGRYCMSGLAYGDGDSAKCVRATAIKFDGLEIAAPYVCQPRDPSKKCQIQFEKADSAIGEVSVDCRCAMTDQTSGFCSSVIGTDAYLEATQQMRLVYENSNCHSLDRHDLGAHRDSCAFQDYRQPDGEEG